ncbi:MAG: 3-isopropylmalate dehydratase large subunit [Hydrogenophilales bacterium]
MKTLYDKLWESHLVSEDENGTSLIYIDRHLLHEVTSPQAFEGLSINNRNPWRTNSVLATADHNTPTKNWSHGIKDPISKIQVDTLDKNIRKFKINNYFPFGSKNQGIVHVIGPETGATLPGMTVVCGDSHTSTHGAFGCLAFGIGTSEVEHVLATQCLVQKKSKSMQINVVGHLNKGVFAKDLVLYIIGVIGTAGGTGYAIEYSGDAIQDLSMEGRMTVCNMTIEAGARAGLISVDDKTIEYVKNKKFSPSNEQLNSAIEYWKTLKTDENATFDKVISVIGNDIKPQVTWGTSPEMVTSIDGIVPTLDSISSEDRKNSFSKALKYMDLKPGAKITDIPIDVVFIGSCTNSRIEDLRLAAEIFKKEKVSKSITSAIVVPGSGPVKEQAEKEGLHEIFIEAGCEWREPGCSMCLGMNDDKLKSGQRSASTSNRNFEGRQGAGGRTHLVSPAMAAAAAVAGHFYDYRKDFNL